MQDDANTPGVGPELYISLSILDLQAACTSLREDIAADAARIGPGNPAVQTFAAAIQDRVWEFQARAARIELIYSQKVSAAVSKGRRKGEEE